VDRTPRDLSAGSADAALDAIMTVTFAVNARVLLYNVFMKGLENQAKDERVERIDGVLDWAYPLSYAALIGVAALPFF
jgi:hypothetical protein